MEKLNAVVLILSDARGQYIPRDFVTDNYGEIAVDHCARWNISVNDAAILAEGPENDFYWETWESVLNNATFINGPDVYHLHQDGDLFGICFDRMTKEEKHNFGFED